MDEKEFQERHEALKEKQAADARERAAREPEVLGDSTPSPSTSPRPEPPPRGPTLESWRDQQGLPKDLREWDFGQLRRAREETEWCPQIGEEMERRGRAARLWEAANVGVRHRQKIGLRETSTGRWRQAFEKLMALAAQGGTAILTGERGRGKTQLAACLIKEACDSGQSSYFCDAAEFFLDIRATFKREANRSEQAVFHRYAGFHLLVIDEAHERSESDWENQTLTRLINVRYADLKPTVLITNEDESTLKRSLGDSIVSRVQETGFLLECDWGNFRAGNGGP